MFLCRFLVDLPSRVLLPPAHQVGHNSKYIKASSSSCQPGQNPDVLFYPRMPHRILPRISVFCTEMHTMPKEKSNDLGRRRGNMNSRRIKLRKKEHTSLTPKPPEHVLEVGYIPHVVNKPSQEWVSNILSPH